MPTFELYKTHLFIDDGLIHCLYKVMETLNDTQKEEALKFANQCIPIQNTTNIDKVTVPFYNKLCKYL